VRAMRLKPLILKDFYLRREKIAAAAQTPREMFPSNSYKS
jgi:hypothetical protein